MADLSIRSLWVRLAAPHLYSSEVSELIGLIRQGNQQACCALYDRYKRPLARFAYYLSENEKRSHKLVQQAFLDLFVLVKDQGSDLKVVPWLYRHIITAYSADFTAEDSVHKDKRTFGLGQEEVEALAKKPREHLLAVLTEMDPRSRAQFLLWVLSGLDSDDQAWVFGLGQTHWQEQWEQASLEAIAWSEIIERDHREEEA